jgi:pyruvate kinase
MNRRSKIVCTLGPTTSSPESIRALVEAGMDVARLNFSHGIHEQHAEACLEVRRASDAVGRSVGILVDLQGPKIRLGTFAGGRADIVGGDEFTISTEPCEGTAKRASTSYLALATDVVPGDTILIDDGLVKLQALSTDGRDVRCRVVEGGTVADHKGINLPGVKVKAPALTDKDYRDLRFALGLRADMVALSFVRRPEDVDAVRGVMDEMGVRLPVIAKLEKPEAVDQLEAIVEAFDGLMVARGDLGVELPLEQVPVVQKQAVQLAREHFKPVIVATQMLDSMIHHSRPTRAEASDVANAVLDGADALMLSGETSVGKYPIESVRTMARIIGAAEEGALGRLPPLVAPTATEQDAIAMAADRVAQTLNARALVAFTQSGATARRLAGRRSPIPLLAFTPVQAVRSQLSLTWAVETFIVPAVGHTDDMVTQVERAMLDLGRGQTGDIVVIVAGSPPGQAGTTNMLRVHHLGAHSI